MTNFRDRLSIDYFKREILKATYGTRPSLVANLDPRTLFLWYLVFAIVPWLVFDKAILLGMVVIVSISAAVTRVSGLIIFLLGFGIVTQGVSLLVTVLIFGGDLSAFWSISTLIMKLLIVSLASVAAFAGLDPERLADGLVKIGLPTQIAFGVSYAFRIIPVLIDEYQAVFNAGRLRTRAPDPGPFRTIRMLAFWFRLILRSFYPMMLNTARRTRTTIEGLEIRGFSYALQHPEVSRIRLGYLRFGSADAIWFAATASALAGVVALGRMLPL